MNRSADRRILEIIMSGFRRFQSNILTDLQPSRSRFYSIFGPGFIYIVQIYSANRREETTTVL